MGQKYINKKTNEINDKQWHNLFFNVCEYIEKFEDKKLEIEYIIEKYKNE